MPEGGGGASSGDWFHPRLSALLMGSQCHSVEKLRSDLYQYPAAAVNRTQPCSKRNNSNNQITPPSKLSNSTFRRTHGKGLEMRREPSCLGYLLVENQMADPSGRFGSKKKKKPT